MAIPSSDEFSQRAQEVAEDLFQQIARDLNPISPAQAIYHLDGSSVHLSYVQALRWVQDSVDEGYPQIRHYIEHAGATPLINLAAFEDPDYQFHP